ncbi:Carbonic anhydrase 2 [Candidatus Ornithobacterium hominis]|uniref:Carbonic anhydrase 2 n=1 Tax=Candidatus Ornithobacterium hominis TaxID=2497989 RepID=A0A383U3P2_9FLAO|nr:carbonate dehydratase [Candidatus Ornithobacterium hominis]MCT7905065.1 carbonate dehydratase [Candidatus Ornithobacterium hominis]CAI9429647.1 carbonate dehydratase [Candidatus Ornithobacterium hominis]SZD73761.1 Carbonic anhydrase 2 [Candidatus Ornithobacterium hominis]SZD74098.1 Carbonic anhydrase 2 [Candidatus Ornithobacterium hominis]
MKKFYNQLLENNKNWVKSVIDKSPDFFSDLSKGQQPPVLWIGCADSRVPANQIIGAKPGEVFVHRNIANMIVHTDMNMLSILDYAVNSLKIKHIIVCGHYGCGGVKAAMGKDSVGIIDNWLRHIKDVYRLHQAELEQIKDKEEKWDRFVELNVEEQVYDLAKTSIVQSAWKNEQELGLHGWVYNIKDGLIKDLGLNIYNDEELEDVYKLNI